MNLENTVKQPNQYSTVALASVSAAIFGTFRYLVENPTAAASYTYAQETERKEFVALFRNRLNEPLTWRQCVAEAKKMSKPFRYQ